MNLTDLLRSKAIDPQQVLVFRHRPCEPKLNKVLPWLAAEKPNVFNAYQQTQGERVERVMTKAKHIAAFIRHDPGKALFVGLYAVKGWSPMARTRFWQVPANVELRTFGMKGFAEDVPRSSVLWFNLELTDFYAHWKGKLIVGWPGLERSWYRWAHRVKNHMPVLAILDESALDAAMPEWNEISLSWEELGVLPTRWKAALAEWRGIYYIYDASDGKAYVGAAYGDKNLLGRWRCYAAKGDGGNRLLRQRDPKQFRFTILQRVSPDMEAGDVIRLEGTWKDRLHTRYPLGLNDN